MSHASRWRELGSQLTCWYVLSERLGRWCCKTGPQPITRLLRRVQTSCTGNYSQPGQLLYSSLFLVFGFLSICSNTVVLCCVHTVWNLQMYVEQSAVAAVSCGPGSAINFGQTNIVGISWRCGVAHKRRLRCVPRRYGMLVEIFSWQQDWNQNKINVPHKNISET